MVENVEKVFAVELLCACQAMEFIRPLRTTTPLEEVYQIVRKVVRSDIRNFQCRVIYSVIFWNNTTVY